jgi:hypothetical protein
MDPREGTRPMSDAITAGILTERRREYTASLDRFDKAITDVDRLIELVDRALDEGQTDVADWLLEQLPQAEQAAAARKAGADVARDAVADARQVAARGQQHHR